MYVQQNTKKYDIPRTVNTTLHQTSVPANNKVLSQVLEFAPSVGVFFSNLRLYGSLGCR